MIQNMTYITIYDSPNLNTRCAVDWLSIYKKKTGTIRFFNCFKIPFCLLLGKPKIKFMIFGKF